MPAIKPNLAKHINFPKDAWEKYWGGSYPSVRLGGTYHPKTNSLNEPLPNIYLKVPTGGGKTLIACQNIDRNKKVI